MVVVVVVVPGCAGGGRLTSPGRRSAAGEAVDFEAGADVVAGAGGAFAAGALPGVAAGVEAGVDSSLEAGEVGVLGAVGTVGAGAGTDFADSGDASGLVGAWTGGETLEAGAAAGDGWLGLTGGVGVRMGVGAEEEGTGAGRELGVGVGAGRELMAAAAAVSKTGAASEAVLAFAESGAGCSGEELDGAGGGFVAGAGRWASASGVRAGVTAAEVVAGGEGVRGCACSTFERVGTWAFADAAGTGVPVAAGNVAVSAFACVARPVAATGADGEVGGGFCATRGAGAAVAPAGVGVAEADEGSSTGVSAVVFAWDDGFDICAEGVAAGAVGVVLAAGRISFESFEVAGGFGADGPAGEEAGEGSCVAGVSNGRALPVASAGGRATAVTFSGRNGTGEEAGEDGGATEVGGLVGVAAAGIGALWVSGAAGTLGVTRVVAGLIAGIRCVSGLGEPSVDGAAGARVAVGAGAGTLPVGGRAEDGAG